MLWARLKRILNDERLCTVVCLVGLALLGLGFCVRALVDPDGGHELPIMLTLLLWLSAVGIFIRQEWGRWAGYVSVFQFGYRAVTLGMPDGFLMGLPTLYLAWLFWTVPITLEQERERKRRDDGKGHRDWLRQLAEQRESRPTWPVTLTVGAAGIDSAAVAQAFSQHFECAVPADENYEGDYIDLAVEAATRDEPLLVGKGMALTCLWPPWVAEILAIPFDGGTLVSLHLLPTHAPEEREMGGRTYLRSTLTANMALAIAKELGCRSLKIGRTGVAAIPGSDVEFTGEEACLAELQRRAASVPA